jgi:hypothetical protein
VAGLFFKAPYQTKAYPVPAGLLMKKFKFFIKSASGNIINPAGPYDSRAEY